MNLKNIRVLVTGGAGFIGSELVRQLVAHKANVIVVDNLINGRRENLEGIPKNRFLLKVTDIRHSSQMAKHMRNIDVVYHLACLGVRHSIHSPLENHQVNAMGTLNVLLLAKANKKIKKFVYVSSSEVYGTAQTVPMSENHPTFPLTVYGASKLAGECYARAFYETYGFPVVVVRPFNAYGPRSHHEGDCGEVIPKFMLRCSAGKPMIIFGDGRQTRDFSYVGDTARGIMLSAFRPEAVGRTMNIGQGKETSIQNLVRMVRQVLRKPLAPTKYEEPRPGDVKKLCADTTLARRLIGFKPTVALDQGLAKLYEWYLSTQKSPRVLLKQERVRNWITAKKLVKHK